MFPRTTELQQIHKVEVSPAGARPPSVDGGWGAAGIGPKSDSWKDWLISIFAGSRAVIQRADGKLCNKDGGRDWRGRRKGRGFSAERDRGIYSDTLSGCFVLRLRPQQDFCRARVSILPSALEWVIKQGADERSPLLCSVPLPVSVSDLL